MYLNKLIVRFLHNYSLQQLLTFLAGLLFLSSELVVQSVKNVKIKIKHFQYKNDNNFIYKMTLKINKEI